MQTVQAVDAQAGFENLLDEVEAGRSSLIARNGRTGAQLPPNDEIDRKAVRNAIQQMKELRKRTKPVSLREILDAKNEGRR